MYLFDSEYPFLSVSDIYSNRVTVSLPFGFEIQIKYEDSNTIACDGVTACSLPATDMLVSQLYDGGGTTWRIRDGVLTDPSAQPVVNGNNINFQAYDWYQVTASDTGELVCEGVRTCSVPNGIYEITRFSDNAQWSVPVGNITQVPVDETNFVDTITVEGRTISWPNNGWYQVQDAVTYEVFCGGADACIVPRDGRYVVINHSLALRAELEIGQATIETDSPTDIPENTDPTMLTEPSVVGNEISWPNNGWYQVENHLTGEIVCQGGLSCTVEQGVYKVIRFFDGGTSGSRVAVGAPTELAVTRDNFAQTLDITDRTIDWSVEGWYQVQNRSDSSEVCNGENSCTVPGPGFYTVINHSLGLRTVVEVL